MSPFILKVNQGVTPCIFKANKFIPPPLIIMLQLQVPVDVQNHLELQASARHTLKNGHTTKGSVVSLFMAAVWEIVIGSTPKRNAKKLVLRKVGEKMCLEISIYLSFYPNSFNSSSLQTFSGESGDRGLCCF